MENKDYIYENYLNMARNFVSNKDYIKALKFYQKAYKFNEGQKDIDLILDMALLYDKLGFKELAEEKYRRVIEIFSPNFPESSCLQYEIVFWNGFCFVQMGNKQLPRLRERAQTVKLYRNLKSFVF